MTRVNERSQRRSNLKDEEYKLIEDVADSLNDKKDPFVQRVFFIKQYHLITATSAAYFTLIIYPENNHGLFFHLSLPGPGQNTLSDIDDASP